jgi:hypothetical protein
MSDATPTPLPETEPGRSGRLLALIRKLIDYGRELATTIRQRADADPGFTRRCFGTKDMVLIVRRIAHGLLLANALEARVQRRAAALDAGPRPMRVRSSPRPAAARPAQRPDPCLDDLPTPEQIAAEIRRRPIGAVIADIRRDLGILPSHPLMREVQAAIMRHGGSFTRLIIDCLDRICPPPPRAAHAGPTLCIEAASGTGPP